jgi:hypothetical protein
MSYVRWSTPIKLPEGVDILDYYQRPDFYNVPTSDFYIYDGGDIIVCLAGNRKGNPEPCFDKMVINGKLNPKWIEWSDKDRVYIDHPDAGKTFYFGSMQEAVDAVKNWIVEGFLAPDWLIERLENEKTSNQS